MLPSFSVPQSSVFSSCIVSQFLDRCAEQNEIMSRFVSCYLKMCFFEKGLQMSFFIPQRRMWNVLFESFITENVPSIWGWLVSVSESPKHRITDLFYKNLGPNTFVGAVNKVITRDNGHHTWNRKALRHLPSYQVYFLLLLLLAYLLPASKEHWIWNAIY